MAFHFLTFKYLTTGLCIRLILLSSLHTSECQFISVVSQNVNLWLLCFHSMMGLMFGQEKEEKQIEALAELP